MIYILTMSFQNIKNGVVNGVVDGIVKWTLIVIFEDVNKDILNCRNTVINVFIYVFKSFFLNNLVYIKQLYIEGIKPIPM